MLQDVIILLLKPMWPKNTSVQDNLYCAPVTYDNIFEIETWKCTSLCWKIILQESTWKGALIYCIYRRNPVFAHLKKTPYIFASAQSQKLYGKLFIIAKKKKRKKYIPFKHHDNMTLVDKSMSEPQKSQTRSIQACTPLKDKNK